MGDGEYEGDRRITCRQMSARLELVGTDFGSLARSSQPSPPMPLGCIDWALGPGTFLAEKVSREGPKKKRTRPCHSNLVRDFRQAMLSILLSALLLAHAGGKHVYIPPQRLQEIACVQSCWQAKQLPTLAHCRLACRCISKAELVLEHRLRESGI